MSGDGQSVSVRVRGDSLLGQDRLFSAMWPWIVERLGLPCVGLSWGRPGEAFKVQGAYAPEPVEHEGPHFREIGVVLAHGFGGHRPAWPVREFALELSSDCSPDVARLRLRVADIEGSEEFLAEVTLRPRSAEASLAGDLEWWTRRLKELPGLMDERHRHPRT